MSDCLICFDLEHLALLVDRLRVPRDVHILIPGACKYVALHGKGRFVDVIKLRTLRFRDELGLSRWAQCYNKSTLKREVGGLQSEKKM